MAEWLKAHAWKACLGETLTWVRIPLSPPVFPSPAILVLQEYPYEAFAFPICSSGHNTGRLRVGPAHNRTLQGAEDGEGRRRWRVRLCLCGYRGTPVVCPPHRRRSPDHGLRSRYARIRGRDPEYQRSWSRRGF